MRAKILLPWGAGARCPCGSDRAYGICCRGVDGGPRTKAFNLEPKPPKTGYGHPRCYLGHTNDCETKISREHILSESILRQFDALAIRNAAGLGGADGVKDIVLPTQAATSNILCSRHNSTLSPLDEVAGKFFSSLHEAVPPIRQPNATAARGWAYADGPKLEAWAIKILAGTHASGNITVQGRPIETAIDREKAKAALYRGEFEPGAGLYVHANNVPNEMDGAQWYLHRTGPLLCGIHICMQGFSFSVVLDATNLEPNALPANATYRPSLHQLYGVGGDAWIVLGWRHKAELRQYSSGQIFTSPTGSESMWPYRPLKGPPELDIRTKFNDQLTPRAERSMAPVSIARVKRPDPPLTRGGQ